MSRVLLTGPTGFIGRHNARQLLFSLAHWLAVNDHAGLVLMLDIRRFGFARRPSPGEREGYYYTKAALLDARDEQRRAVRTGCIDSCAVAGGTGAQRLGEMLERVLVVCAAHRDELTILHYDWQSLSTIDELKDIQDRSTQTLNVWQAVVAEGIADGSIKATVNPDLLMRVITSSIHGILDPIRYRGRSLGRGPSAHDLAAFLQLVVLDGVASATPPPRKNGSRPSTPGKVVTPSRSRRQS